MAGARAVLLDDRVLIEELLVGLDLGRRHGDLYTTSYWYYRACRAAVAGAGGHLSGPFERLQREEQESAILSLLELRDDIGLPDPRITVPAMAGLARRHAQLNLLNLEAVATALTLRGEVFLSTKASSGVLPRAFESESVPWRTMDVSGPP